MNAAAITFDIDWAPDWAIADCADACARHRVPATFFVTHDSPVVRSLASEPLFELGAHPNFAPNSSHGRTPQDVIEYCLELVPHARAFRTHMLIQSSPLMLLIRKLAPKWEFDLSLYLHFHPGLQPTPWRFQRDAAPIWRLPYFWEDDFAAADPDWRWDGPVPPSDGLSIFDFHPILVALNVTQMDSYSKLKAVLGARPMNEVSRDEVAGLRSKEFGNADFFDSLLKQTRDFRQVSRIMIPELVGDAGCA